MQGFSQNTQIVLKKRVGRRNNFVHFSKFDMISTSSELLLGQKNGHFERFTLVFFRKQQFTFLL